MCLVHNMLIRGLNSIYLQGPNVSSPTDIADLMTNAYSWSKTIHIHHSNEERLFFGWIEGDIGVKHGEVLGDNVRQHHSFREGLRAFDDYVEKVREGREGIRYDRYKVRELLDGFCKGEEGLYRHLEEEIETFERLEEYGDRINWKRWNERVQKEAVGNADFHFEIPFALTNLDVTYENGIHTSVWPPFPRFIALLFRWRDVPKHKGAWRFSSCDARDRPRELPFV